MKFQASAGKVLWHDVLKCNYVSKNHVVVDSSLVFCVFVFTIFNARFIWLLKRFLWIVLLITETIEKVDI